MLRESQAAKLGLRIAHVLRCVVLLLGAAMEKRERWIGIGIGVAFILGGCNQQQQPVQQAAAAPKPIAVKQAPPTPIETKRVELGGPAWDPGWDTLIERGLPPEMLSSKVPQDVRRFCPRFFEMSNTDKRAYWAYFFQALAGAEAGLNAKTNVLHSDTQTERDQVTGQTIRSEGLMQLTYEDAKRYGCDFDWKADRQLPLKDPRKTILNPANNLACGIKILDAQIIGQRRPLFSRVSYWSTLRPGTLSYRVFAKQMTNPPAACGWQEQTSAPVPTRRGIRESEKGRTAGPPRQISCH